jgi:hypothetical protein
MPDDDTQNLLNRLVRGDPTAVAEVVQRAAVDRSPALLVAAALVTPDRTTLDHPTVDHPTVDRPTEDGASPRGLLERAGRNAVTTRDRQLVAIAAARLDDDEDLVGALVGDHLSDHPDSTLATWIAAGSDQLHPTHQEHSCDR